MSPNRRDFLRRAALSASAAAGAAMLPACNSTPGDPHAKRRPASQPVELYRISLAQWSLHRTLRRGELDNLDFPKVTRVDYELDGAELVNQFFKDKATDARYLGALRMRATDFGVKLLLIMIDGEGALGAPDAAARARAIENHRRWLEAAQRLGCHSIRVNAETGGAPREEAAKNAMDGLRRLAEIAVPYGLNVIVENHGGLSSDGSWLADVIRRVEMKNCGTLPDFGNFRIAEGRYYDRYLGVQEMMPYAKAVSAKSHDFDEDGNEIHTDYRRMMRIVLDSGYRGWVGIEFEGDKISEPDGILRTKRLLQAVHAEFVAAGMKG